MLDDPFHEFDNHLHEDFVEDRLIEPLLEDIVDAELVKDDFVEDRVPEDRFDDVVPETGESVAEDRLDDVIDAKIEDDKFAKELEDKPEYLEAELGDAYADQIGSREEGLDWDGFLEEGEFEVPDNIFEDVTGPELSDLASEDDMLEDGKTETLAKIELGDLVPDKLKKNQDYLNPSSGIYVGQTHRYKGDYSQLSEDDKKRAEAEKGYVKPRAERAFPQTKVRRGPRKYRSPVQSQETVFHKKNYGRGQTNYKK